MSNDKVLNRFLLAMAFVVLMTFVFLFTPLNTPPENASVLLKIIYFFTLYGFFVCLLAGLVLSTVCVFKEEYELVWLFELFNAVGFVFLMLGTLPMSTSKNITLIPGYALIVFEMLVLNFFNLGYRLALKIKLAKKQWQILIEKKTQGIKDVFEEESSDEFQAKLNADNNNEKEEEFHGHGDDIKFITTGIEETKEKLKNKK